MGVKYGIVLLVVLSQRTQPADLRVMGPPHLTLPNNQSFS